MNDLIPNMITGAEFAAMMAGKAKPNKYHAKRTNYDGTDYDSRMEALRAGELNLSLHAGDIKAWARQPQFVLRPSSIKYKADFLVVGKDDSIWIEDVKGVATKEFKGKLHLWRDFGIYPLHILKRIRGGWNIEIVEATK